MEIAFLVAIVLVIWWSLRSSAKKLDDPNDRRNVYLSEMQAQCNLSSGRVSVVLMRQSGNVYRELGVFESKESAFNEVQKSFRRAGIDAVHIAKNTSFEFRVNRLFHSHRGRSEGKKLGGAVIYAE